MAEAASNSVTSLNGDAVLEVSVHNLESNSELVVLPKGGDNKKNDDLGADFREDAVKVIHSRVSHDTRIGQADAACDNTEPTETEVDSGRANFSARSNKEKSGGNAAVLSNDSDEDRNGEFIAKYRGEVIDVSDNSDSSDSDTSSTVSDDNDDSDNLSIRSSSDNSDTGDKITQKVTRTKGELTIQDLPPIEDLKISVDENQCKPVGSILNIVEEIVVIQSFPNTPALDIDTVLFLDRGQRALGKIFDVFGPVQEPFYSVRFNSREHIQERDVRREQVVYCAPQTEYTSYIPVAQLLKEKGSDASWNNNNEPPETYLDFSDDEAEARHKRSKKNTGSKRDAPSDNDLYVKKMNQKNLELTAKRRKEDEAKQKRGSTLRRVPTGPASQPRESLASAATTTHPFAPFSKSRTFSNSSSSSGDQACSSTFFHHPAASKYEAGPAPRAVNYLRNAATASAYTTPPVAYAFPAPRPFVRSSPRQLPNPAPPSSTAATQNYLAMFHHHRAQPTTALSMAASPFTPFAAATMPPMPSALHAAMPPQFNAAVPPPPPSFAGFNPMPAAPLPSALPQPSFFASRADAASVHPATFMPLGVPPTFHPPFVLPPPPPPPPPPVTLPQAQPAQPQHQRDASTASRASDRRVETQSSHQTNRTFHHSSPRNS